MKIKCTQCGTKSDASNELFKNLIGVLALFTFLTAVAVFVIVPFIGLLLLCPSIWFTVLANSKKLPKCKVCGGHTIPYTS